MRRHLTGLDHCTVLVPDLPAASATFTRLGFTVSPLGRHSPDMGTANHAVTLTGNYFELLGVLTETEFNKEIRDALSMRQGVAGVALRADDTAAAVAELRAAGLAATDPHAVRRNVGLPSGAHVEAEFTIAFFPEIGPPYLQLFCSQALTPQYVWIPELMEHPNTAHRIEWLGVVAGGQDLGINTAFGDVSVVELALGEYVEADRLGSTVLSLSVGDLSAAEKCLREGGVPYRSLQDGLVVPAQYACGVVLEMREGEGR
ncbi:VOC family protein [Amycolatopsis sp. NPDC051903]|uniref:VOC family protein n=1 Tax=Amycolatopsis sp. NPDC051903 TaxID=3363936 RepID=UPI0037B2571C